MTEPDEHRPRPSVAERAALTAGVDMWHFEQSADLGLRPIKVTDGPAGARGARWFGSTSACAPCGSTMGATWSPETVAEVASVMAEEVRRKGADVLLAPTVNLHRHPLAGRNFECYSEDPELTAALATAFITGLQAEGVGACVKHFVANDQETDRHDISAEVPEVALRELYLRPFEAAVRVARTWSVMSAYNRLGGTHCSQHHWLLTDLFRDEWGFDGVVVSDWWGTHDVDALAAGLDVEMPGPAIYLGAAVEAAIDGGSVATSDLDRAVNSILRLAERVGALDEGHGPAPERSEDNPADREVLHRAAVEAIVLLRNNGADQGDAGATALLPLSGSGTIAVIGPNADATAVMGGGSASFLPHHRSGLLEALRARVGSNATIVHEPGVLPHGGLQPLDRRSCRIHGDSDADAGFTVEHFTSSEPDGAPVLREVTSTSRLLWLGEPGPGVPTQGSSVRLSTLFTPTVSGSHVFGLVTGSTGWLSVDGNVVLDNRSERRPGTAFFGLGSEEIRAEVQLVAGDEVQLVAVTAPVAGVDVGGLNIGHAPPAPADPLARAVEAASTADVAVVVVGGDDQWETEGNDRASFNLPEGQDDLVRAVTAANPRTVVVLNCGSPVDLSCADAAPALLQAWYPGQEAGEAITDVLLGTADPGGRLPTTFGREVADWSSDRNFPGSGGSVSYDEGLRVGYRDFDSTGTEPAFCFGHGLSLGEVAWTDAQLDVGNDRAAEVVEGSVAATASLMVTNDADRPATEVVQCYLSPVAGDTVDSSRPPQHLAGFSKVHLAAGEQVRVEIPIGWTALRRWTPGRGWTVPSGTWEVRLSASSRDHRFRMELQLG